VVRPRVRAADGSGELHLPSYDLFSSTEVLGRLAMEKMLAGLSSRRYTAGLEPAGQAVAGQAVATSKSAVSRRFAATTETALAELMSWRLDDLDLVALMIDGVHFGEHTCVVALGIGIDGTKHPLAVEEGSTENATLVTGLITGLRERGLDVTRPILAVLDGAKAWPVRSATCSTSRSSKDANSTRSKTSGTNCPNGCGRWPSGGCARPTTPNRPSKPRVC